MNPFKQALALTRMGLAGLPQRPGASLVVICAMAGAVAVLICVFAMAGGFTRTLLDTAHDDRAIVLRTDARSEMGSELPIEWAPIILNAPGVRKTPGNTPLASAEMLSIVRLTDKRTGLDAFATMRGLGSEGFALRPEIRIIEGRMFERGKLELIVGRSVQRKLEGLEVGDRLLLPQGEWTVVGAFESGGDSHQSELLTDVSTLLNAAKRKFFNSITVALDGGRVRKLANRARGPPRAIGTAADRDRVLQSGRAVGQPSPEICCLRHRRMHAARCTRGCTECDVFLREHTRHRDRNVESARFQFTRDRDRLVPRSARSVPDRRSHRRGHRMDLLSTQGDQHADGSQRRAADLFVADHGVLGRISYRHRLRRRVGRRAVSALRAARLGIAVAIRKVA